MQVSHSFAVTSAVFDDEHLVSYAGLVAVMTLAEQTGFPSDAWMRDQCRAEWLCSAKRSSLRDRLPSNVS